MSGLLPDRTTLRRFYLVGLVILAILLALVWQQMQSPRLVPLMVDEAQPFDPVREPIQPLPATLSIARGKLALGQRLFSDTRLSGDGQVSCVSCHSFEAGGADTVPRSIGVNGAVGPVNAPTVFNLAYNFRFNWNGKFDNLVAHTEALMQNPVVMGSQWPDLVQTLAADADYRQSFAEVYENGVTKDTIIDAIVAYESSLITPNAPFDRYLRGDQSALSPQAQEGYRLFKAYGCVSCHQGVNVGGNIFQKFGVLGDYFADRGNITEADYGRYNVTGQDADRFVFRVPSLRNVAETPPYFHDGSAETLEKAIAVMVKYQLGRPIPAADVQRIAEFLRSLTGEHNGVSLQAQAQP